MPLSTFVTLSRFDEGKEIRIVCSKMTQKSIASVVATLQRRCGNFLIASESDVVTTWETDVGTALMFDRVTALWQRSCASWEEMFNFFFSKDFY